MWLHTAEGLGTTDLSVTGSCMAAGKIWQPFCPAGISRGDVTSHHFLDRNSLLFLFGWFSLFLVSTGCRLWNMTRTWNMDAIIAHWDRYLLCTAS